MNIYPSPFSEMASIDSSFSVCSSNELPKTFRDQINKCKDNTLLCAFSEDLMIHLLEKLQISMKD